VTFAILPRSAWRARPPAAALELIRRPAIETFVHHEAATFTSLRAADEVAALLSIQRFHMSTRGYRDIAYSFAIAPSGRIYECRGWGKRGAHTGGARTPRVDENSVAHGVVMIGNYDRQRPTPAALASLVWLIKYGRAHGWIAPSAPVLGHRDVDSTACPGRTLYAALPAVRRALIAVPAHSAPAPDPLATIKAALAATQADLAKVRAQLAHDQAVIEAVRKAVA
jgi:hypothetical protein